MLAERLIYKVGTIRLGRVPGLIFENLISQPEAQFKSNNVNTMEFKLALPCGMTINLFL